MCYTWWLYFCQWFSCWLTSKLNLNFGGGRRSSRRWSIQDLTSSALPLSFLYVSKNQGVQKAQPKTIILKICETPNGVNGGKSHDTVPVYLLVLPDGSAEIWIHKGDILACQCSLTVNFPYTYR